MSTFEILMKPQGVVLDAYMRSRARVSMIQGPLGSGKTYQSCQKLLTLMSEQAPDNSGVRKTRFYAVRNTYPDLMSTTVKDWLDLFGDLGRFKGGGIEPPTHYLEFKLPDGSLVQSEVVFIALDREDSVKKLRGSQVTGFWLNEVKELPRAIIDMADLRHGRYPSAMDGGPTWHGMIGDTNAPDDDHWYYDLAEEQKPSGWEFFRQPGGLIRSGVSPDGRILWRTNPLAENISNLPDGYYTRGAEGKRDDWIAVNLANEYGSTFDGRPVYPEYSDVIHIAKEELKPYKGIPLILSWDFGLTPSCIFSQVTRRGQWRILHEECGESIGIRQFIASVIKPVLAGKFNGLELVSVGDPAGSQRSQSDERTCFDELKAAGITTRPARSNDPTARREAVAGFLNRMTDGEPSFLLSPNCKMLRKGFAGGYQYKRIRSGDGFTDQPDKNKFSHPHDALQYSALYIEGPAMKVAHTPYTPYVVASNAGY